MGSLSDYSAVAGGEVLNRFLPPIEAGVNLLTKFNAGIAKLTHTDSAEEQLTKAKSKIDENVIIIEKMIKRQQEGKQIHEDSLAAIKKRTEKLMEERRILQSMINDKEKAAGGTNPEVSEEATKRAQEAAKKVEEEKEKQAKKSRNAMIKLQNDFFADREKQVAQAQEAFEKSQQEQVNTLSQYENYKISLIENKYERERALLDKWLKDQQLKYKDNAIALENIQKQYALQSANILKEKAKDDLDRNKKLDAQLDELKSKAYKDELSSSLKIDDLLGKSKAQLYKKEQALRLLDARTAKKDAEKNYRDMVKLANGNAKEIAKAEEIKWLSIKAANDEYGNYIRESEANKKQLAKDTAQQSLSTLTDMLQSAAAKHKEAAIAYKALAYTQTVIDTYKGAQSSYNALAGITVVGPILGALAAGVAIAAGLVRANEIRKQQFASGGTSNGGLAIVGEMGRELVNLSPGSQVINHHQTQQLINNSNRGTTINLTIQGSNGRVSNQLTREFRNGSGDYLMKVISKQIARRG